MILLPSPPIMDYIICLFAGLVILYCMLDITVIRMDYVTFL